MLPEPHHVPEGCTALWTKVAYRKAEQIRDRFSTSVRLGKFNEVSSVQFNGYDPDINRVTGIESISCEPGEATLRHKKKTATVIIPVQVSFTFSGRANGFEFTGARARCRVDVCTDTDQNRVNIERDDISLLECEVEGLEARELECSYSRLYRKLEVRGLLTGSLISTLCLRFDHETGETSPKS